MSSDPEMAREFTVHCGECGHSWVLAYFPLDVEQFAHLAKHAACPRGHRAPILCGTAPAKGETDAGEG